MLWTHQSLFHFSLLASGFDNFCHSFWDNREKPHRLLLGNVSSVQQMKMTTTVSTNRIKPALKGHTTNKINILQVFESVIIFWDTQHLHKEMWVHLNAYPNVYLLKLATRCFSSQASHHTHWLLFHTLTMSSKQMTHNEWVRRGSSLDPSSSAFPKGQVNFLVTTQSLISTPCKLLANSLQAIWKGSAQLHHNSELLPPTQQAWGWLPSL